MLLLQQVLFRSVDDHPHRDVLDLMWERHVPQERLVACGMYVPHAKLNPGMWPVCVVLFFLLWLHKHAQRWRKTHHHITVRCCVWV